jgi:Magnesium chelatase, subunit ChlI
MLARRLGTILPAMTLAEAIETMRIHRVAGLTGDRTALVTTRPCRAPHQTLSDAGLIGGGHGPMLGDVSLACTTAGSSGMGNRKGSAQRSRGRACRSRTARSPLERRGRLRTPLLGDICNI